MDPNLPGDIAIGIFLTRETTETQSRVGLEISMSFVGITPAGRLVSVIFAMAIIIMIAIILLKRGGSL